MSYCLSNGILYHDGEPEIAFGVSYYASFHPQKVPVPPEGDREGEMLLDLNEIRELGFNLVRTAALGKVEKDKTGKITAGFPLTAKMAEQAEKLDLAMLVRLHGYSYNFANAADAEMLDSDFNEIPGRWNAFVRNCLNHPGALRDNADATTAIASQFRGCRAAVGFLIYNEPAYPGEVYDYNPHSIRAWREWMVDRGLKTKAEADTLFPPRSHELPLVDPRKPFQIPEDAVQWHLFRTERMCDFLNGLGEEAKAACPGPETMTCLLTCRPGFTATGEDYFQIAERMDVVGMTHYIPSSGPYIYVSTGVMELAESAAALYGKHLWLVESDARVSLSPDDWECQTITALGCGAKGIVYYEWRGDYPYPESPEPDAFGIIRNDRRKTEKYSRIPMMHALLKEIGSRLVYAEKERSGVAVLFSGHANAASWVVSPRGESSIVGMYRACSELRKAGAAVDFVRTCDLKKNILKIRLLVVYAEMELYSKEELAELRKAEWKGIRIFYFDREGVFLKGSDNDSYFDHDSGYDACDVLKLCGISPLCSSDIPQVDTHVLRGKGGDCAIVSVVNTSPTRKSVPAGGSIRLNLKDGGLFSRAAFYSCKRVQPLEMKHDAEESVAISLPAFETGGFVILEKQA